MKFVTSIFFVASLLSVIYSRSIDHTIDGNQINKRETSIDINNELDQVAGRTKSMSSSSNKMTLITIQPDENDQNRLSKAIQNDMAQNDVKSILDTLDGILENGNRESSSPKTPSDQEMPDPESAPSAGLNSSSASQNQNGQNGTSPLLADSAGSTKPSRPLNSPMKRPMGSLMDSPMDAPINPTTGSPTGLAINSPMNLPKNSNETTGDSSGKGLTTPGSITNSTGSRQPSNNQSPNGACPCSCLCGSGSIPNSGKKLNSPGSGSVSSSTTKSNSSTTGSTSMMVNGVGVTLANGVCSCSCLCPSGSFSVSGMGGSNTGSNTTTTTASPGISGGTVNPSSALNNSTQASNPGLSEPAIIASPNPAKNSPAQNPAAEAPKALSEPNIISRPTPAQNPSAQNPAAQAQGPKAELSEPNIISQPTPAQNPPSKKPLGPAPAAQTPAAQLSTPGNAQPNSAQKPSDQGNAAAAGLKDDPFNIITNSLTSTLDLGAIKVPAPTP